MTNNELKEKISLKYQDEFNNIFSLISLAEKDFDSSFQIPAICLSSTEKELNDLFLEHVIKQIEKINKADITSNYIFNSNDYFETGNSGGQIKIEEIRDLIAFSSYKKETLRYKYIVVKNIEKANIYALNSLLKLIEEPSVETIFICTTTTFSSLLSTIKSRLFKIELPSKLTLSDFQGDYSDEFLWLSKQSFDILKFSSELSYTKQKKVLSALREKSVRELFDEYALICLEEDSLTVEGVALENAVLKKLFTLCIAEKLLFSESSDEHSSLFLASSEFLKGFTSASGDVFFKELFSITENLLFSIFQNNIQNLNNRSTYTFLTIQLLKSELSFNQDELLKYIRFLERIRNSVQINCNRELLFYNYLLGLKKILNRK